MPTTNKSKPTFRRSTQPRTASLEQRLKYAIDDEHRKKIIAEYNAEHDTELNEKADSIENAAPTKEEQEEFDKRSARVRKEEESFFGNINTPITNGGQERFAKAVKQGEEQLKNNSLTNLGIDYKTAVDNQVQNAKDNAYKYKLMAKSLWEAAKLSAAVYGGANAISYLARNGKTLPLGNFADGVGVGMDALETPSSIIDMSEYNNYKPFIENTIQEGAGTYAATMKEPYQTYSNGTNITKWTDKIKLKHLPAAAGLISNAYQIYDSIDKMTSNMKKLGGKSTIQPNVIRGGQAIPLGNNFYYMRGRKHSAGGIDIGKDLEVEGGEVMKMGKRDIKVYSSVPFLNGKSPAERVMNGENANDVFNAQQRYKKVNRIKDDGSKYMNGGRKKAIMGTDDYNYITRPDLLAASHLVDGAIAKQRQAKDFIEYQLIDFTDKIQRAKNKELQKRINQSRVDPVLKQLTRTGKSKDRESLVRGDTETDYGYIGGSTHDSRQTYLDRDIEFSDSIRSIAKQYKINANVLASRIAAEGPIDNYIRMNNANIKWAKNNIYVSNPKQGGPDRTTDHTDGGPWWGLDDLGSNLRKGKVKLKTDASWSDVGFTNEKDRTTNSAVITTQNRNGWAGAIHGVASELAYRRTEMKKRFPNATDDELNSMALAAFNRGIHGATTFIKQGNNVQRSYPVNYNVNKKQFGGKYNNMIYSLTTDKGQSLHHIPSTGEKTQAAFGKHIIRQKAKLGKQAKALAKKLKFNTTIDKHEKLGEIRKSSNYTLDTENLRKRLAEGITVRDTYENAPNVQRVDEDGNFLTRHASARELITGEKDKPLPDYNFTPQQIIQHTKNAKKAVADRNISNQSKGIFKNNTTSDLIGAGIGAIGSIGSALINNSMLNNLQSPSQPVGRIASKLKTKVNVNPQLDEVNNTVAANNRNVDSNTASSRVALARKQRNNLAGLQSKNAIYANKENAETTLINQDKMNQQQVANQNIEEYNNWQNNKTNFENTVREKKAENWNSLLGNINLIGQDLLSRPEKRQAEHNNLMATVAANPNVSPRILRGLGFKGFTDEDIRRWEETYRKK